MIERKTDQYEPMRRLLRAWELTGKNLQQTLGCSIETAYKRYRDPGTLTLVDLIRLCTDGEVPKNAILQTIYEIMTFKEEVNENEETE